MNCKINLKWKARRRGSWYLNLCWVELPTGVAIHVDKLANTRGIYNSWHGIEVEYTQANEHASWLTAWMVIPNQTLLQPKGSSRLVKFPTRQMVRAPVTIQVDTSSEITGYSWLSTADGFIGSVSRTVVMNRECNSLSLHTISVSAIGQAWCSKSQTLRMRVPIFQTVGSLIDHLGLWNVLVRAVMMRGRYESSIYF